MSLPLQTIYDCCRFGIEYETLLDVVDLKSANDLLLLLPPCVLPPGIHDNWMNKIRHNLIASSINALLIQANTAPSTWKWSLMTANKDGTLCIPGIMRRVANPQMTLDDRPWIIASDSSVQVNQENRNHYTNHDKQYSIQGAVINGIEFISPPLRITNHDDLINLKTMIESVIPTQFTCFHNQTTSTHVHISFNYAGKDNLLLNPANLFKVCMTWLYYEPVFMFLCDKNRRVNPYCNSMISIMLKHKNKLFGNNDDIATQKLEAFILDTSTKISLTIDEVIAVFQGSSRYASLNMLNLLGGTGTIEVRLKEGTSSADEIILWVELLVAVFANAINQIDTVNNYLNKDERTFFMHTQALSTMDRIDDESKRRLVVMYHRMTDSISESTLKIYWRNRLMANLGINR
jgi:hypothetical protein